MFHQKLATSQLSFAHYCHTLSDILCVELGYLLSIKDKSASLLA